MDNPAKVSLTIVPESGTKKLTQRRDGEKEASMNKVVLVGRLTKDPETRYAGSEEKSAVARYTLAVERKVKKEHEPAADFIPCVAFQKQAEFAEKYFRQGIRIYTMNVVIEEQEFAESRREQEQSRQTAAPTEPEREDTPFH